MSSQMQEDNPSWAGEKGDRADAETRPQVGRREGPGLRGKAHAETWPPPEAGSAGTGMDAALSRKGELLD